MARVPELLSSHEVAHLLGMNPASVVRWVNAGKLPAFRTPGGHHRIKVADLVVFLRANRMSVPAELATSRRILIVDDNPSHLASAREALAGVEGLEVEAHSSGIRALLRIGAEKPAAVVLSSQLRELDALQVLRALKAELGSQEIAVVITAHGLTQDLSIRAQVLGANAVIALPEEASKLRRVLLHWAAGGAEPPPR